MTDPSSPALDALRRQVREQLALLSYPGRDWVRPIVHASGLPVHDVVIIGAGQAGLGTALALRRDGVANVLVIDAQPPGREGVWETFARMTHLRTPKATVGIEGGVPALAAPSFYRAAFGEVDWAAIERIERPRWMAFLRWFRDAAGIEVCNDTACTDLAPEEDLVALTLRVGAGDRTRKVLARQVVLASGYDGAGCWQVPPAIAAAVAPQRLNHSNEAIDFAKLAGKRVGILGHGASAFDNACVALDHGAASVDLCFRREHIPTINPHRRLEFAGFLKHFHELPDLTRWRTNRFFEVHDQPPTQNGWDRAHRHPGFRVHAGSPWLEVNDDGAQVWVRTPHALLTFDHVICATGSVVDYDARPELRRLGPVVRRWRHAFTPPAGETSDTLAEYPYLGAGFEYLPLHDGNDWVRRVRAFNFSSVVSMGPHTTSASGHKYAIPRLVGGITAALMAEQADALLPALEAYDEVELRPVPPPTESPQDGAGRPVSTTAA